MNEKIFNIIFQKYISHKIMKLISMPFNTEYTAIILILVTYFKIFKIYDTVFILTGVLLIFILKVSFNRERPFKKYPNEIKNYGSSSYTKIGNRYSYPSGHAFISMLIILFLNKRCDTNKITFIIPFLVSISRITLGVHYLSDVITGSLIAYLYIKFYEYLNDK
uniref:PAP2 superfamily protein n=1 Tax=Megaviridae environmental sample TaxID=1737588 RepID=A0A5J6VM58_9VIRU|nr:MAG: PAP2 superfamily protein [Megaviridae environmental sample]